MDIEVLPMSDLLPDEDDEAQGIPPDGDDADFESDDDAGSDDDDPGLDTEV
jgi:hypothetical protein